MLSGNYDSLLNSLPNDNNVITGSGVMASINNVAAEIAGDDLHKRYTMILMAFATLYGPTTGQGINDFVTGGAGCPNCLRINLPNLNAIKSAILGQGGDWARYSGILRDAAGNAGNHGLGTAIAEEAMMLGEAWVGPNYVRSTSDPKILISADGLRQFRPPSFKPGWQGGTVQANFEWRWASSGQWQGNGHLDITP